MLCMFSYFDHGMDLEKAYSGCAKDHAAILVAHQPKAAKIALDSEYNIALVLSGMCTSLLILNCKPNSILEYNRFMPDLDPQHTLCSQSFSKASLLEAHCISTSNASTKQ